MDARQKKIAIIGAGEAGRLLARDIQKKTAHIVMGFFDDQETGKMWLGKVGDLSKAANENAFDEAVIAIPSAPGVTVRKILLANAGNDMPIRIVPRTVDILQTSQVNYSGVKSIEPEDFLGRPVRKDNLKYLADCYRNKRIMVTGGAGSIGSEIVRQLISFGAGMVTVFDTSEYFCFALEQDLAEIFDGARHRIIIGNILEKQKVRRVMADHKPDIVIHAAAYKHVHLMEENADEALKVNLVGTMNVVECAGEVGVSRLVFVSTDKVVNPQSVMGMSKKLAEEYAVASTREDLKVSAVRFGNVINSYGSVLPLFDQQMRDRKELTVTDPAMKRFFMSIREAAELVLMSGSYEKGGMVYVLDMGDLIPIIEVARCMIRSWNMRPEVDIEIKIIGRRPGEKLIEELFTEEEKRQMVDSGFKNIKTVSSTKSLANVKLIAEMVRREVESWDAEQARVMLHRIWPSKELGIPERTDAFLIAASETLI